MYYIPAGNNWRGIIVIIFSCRQTSTELYTLSISDRTRQLYTGRPNNFSSVSAMSTGIPTYILYMAVYGRAVATMVANRRNGPSDKCPVQSPARPANIFYMILYITPLLHLAVGIPARWLRWLRLAAVFYGLEAVSDVQRVCYSRGEWNGNGQRGLSA